MLARVIVGVIIGLVAGLFLSKPASESNKNGLVLAFIALIVIAFIASSFMFGAVYGAMAIGEIALGYWLSTVLKSQIKPRSE